jgi:tRNA (guanine26-N2/guanine27-N2)-dimethyltransferase
LAVRLLCGCLVETAAKQDIAVKVVFSHKGEHYVRAYATIKYGAKDADESLGSRGYILHCFNCFHREKGNLYEVQRSGRCPECGSKLNISGPLWLGRLFDPHFVETMEEENARRKLRLGGAIQRMLTIAKTEVEAPITYYVVDKLCDSLNLPVPSVDSVIKALENEGFQACRTHYNTRGIRTNASATKLRCIMPSLAKRNTNTEMTAS